MVLVGLMTDEVDKNDQEMAARIEEGVFYRVAFLCVLDPDRIGPDRIPARVMVYCPHQNLEVAIPSPVSKALEELSSHVAVILGEESSAEHLGYVAYLREDEARLAAKIIALYAEQAVRDIASSGYVHFEIEVSVCAWEVFGNQPNFNDSIRLELITIARPETDERAVVC